MPRLGIAKGFLADYAKLDKVVQRSVLDAIGKFGEHTHAGLHLEKLANSRDRRIRTIRITQFWRGVVLAPDKGDEHTLLAVLPHDDAIAYAVSRVFSVNQAIGVLEVRDQKAIEDLEPALRQVAAAVPERLFDHVKDSELVALGVDVKLLPLVRVLTADPHLEALESLLPAPQYDALIALASGMTPEEAWQEVSKHLASDVVPAEVDPEDITAAAERTPDRYALVSGPDELAEVLAHPFAAWRVFLHGKQRDIAYRPSYSGPVMVSGGPGTGKTVTALHRAVFLANALRDGERLLLTTFTRNLAGALEKQLALLGYSGDKIDVTNVDKFAYGVVHESTGAQPEFPKAAEMRKMWQRAAQDTGFSPVFLEREWEQVVLAQGLADRQAYLDCARHGRGKALNATQREKAWAAMALVVDMLRRRGQATHLLVADQATSILRSRAEELYRHVVVDEAQDLHPAQWRLLRAAVAVRPDDLFLVGDPHQRIYDNRVSLAGLGITIRGRSHRLTISYRTTQEILDWSIRVLAGEVEGLDGESDALAGYRSPMHGRRPIVKPYRDRKSELDGLVQQVREWTEDGVEASAIGVAARTGALAEEAERALADFPAVHTGTMHGMKGLEFRCVVLVGVDHDVVPASWSVTPLDEDPVAHEHDVRRERCLLFVATTRARDVVVISHGQRPSQFLSALS